MPDPQVEAAAEASAQAALNEAEERGGGTSPEDIEAYATVAGAVAGAAACSAVGAAAAAPLCAWVAGEVAGWIADTVTGWFTDDEEAEAARQRRADVAAHFASMGLADELNLDNGNAFQGYLEDLRALHSELWPGDRWLGDDPNHFQAEWMEPMLLMLQQGAPIVASEGMEVALGLESLRRYWSELDQLGIGTAAKRTRILAEADRIAEATRRAYDRSVLVLTTKAAAATGVLDARNEAAKGRISERIAERLGYGEFRRDEPTVSTAADWAHTPAIESPEMEAHYSGRSDPYIPPEKESWGKALAGLAGVGLVAGGLAYFKPFRRFG